MISNSRFTFVAAGLLLGAVVSATAQQISPASVLGPAVPKFSAFGDLRDRTGLAARRIWREGDPVIVKDDLDPGERAPGTPSRTPDPLLRQQRLGPLRLFAADAFATIPIPTNYDGIPSTGFDAQDPVGAVGPNHYIQMVNSQFAVYDKGGNMLTERPLEINSLWTGFGGPCEQFNEGDPIVRYDHLADRWLVSQFQIHHNMQCIAISRTPDPVSGGWILYAFPTVDASGANIVADYPKIGVWPDGYYMSTQRGFDGGGLDVWVFERDKMLAGQPARTVQFSIQAPTIVLQPSDLTGPAPPVGTPNFLLRQVQGSRFGGQDRLEMLALRVNWASPQMSTLQKLPDLPVAAFNSILCDDTLIGPCVPQPQTGVKLSTISVWPMFPAQYRTFGDHESLLLNHTVNVDGNGRAGIRWYELRRPPGGSWGVFQQGTHSPDAVNRWMGSLAMDAAGNIALAYSVSSSQVNPGIRVAIRHANDAPGSFGPEANVVEGHGAQTNGPRWGDYTSMTIDPSHPCAFWFTGLYYQKTSLVNWSTRIAEIHPPGFTADCNPEVPNLSGLTLSQAREFMAHFGLAVGAVHLQPNEAGPGKLTAPVVVGQSTDAGAATQKVARIDLTLQRVRQ